MSVVTVRPAISDLGCRRLGPTRMDLARDTPPPRQDRDRTTALWDLDEVLEAEDVLREMEGDEAMVLSDPPSEQLEREFMSYSQCQVLGQLADPASD